MEKTRRVDLRSIVALLAVAFAAAALWAATALAGGESSSSDDPARGDDPVAAFIQAQDNGEDEGDDGRLPWGEDCPEDEGGFDRKSGSDDSDSSPPGSADF